MKKILAFAMLLYAVGVRAQTGMPQSLSCTETAFNFSFSLGSKWRFVAPKMGPVEIRNTTADIPAWAFKVNHVPTEKQSASPFQNSLNVKQQVKYLLPEINFAPFINYNFTKPDWKVIGLH